MIATVLILGAAVLSCWLQVTYISHAKALVAMLDTGQVGICYNATDIGFRPPFDPGTTFVWHKPALNLRLPEAFFYSPACWGISAPLWTVLGGLLIVAMLLWRLDRPYGPGHCQHCGYDLTGNVSGVCPECRMNLKSADCNFQPTET